MSKPYALTPMMEQYLSIKKENPDSIIFFRMGDFYEIFFDDAVLASGILNIVLTKRGTDEKGEPIPMCGVPFHSYSSYLSKLVQNGYKVAICEQLESPEEAKKRGSKTVVKRAVVKTVTPGTIIDDSILESSDNNFLLSVFLANKRFYLSWIDISTNELFINEASEEDLQTLVYNIAPKEIITYDAVIEYLQDFKNIITENKKEKFNYENSTFYIKNTLENSSFLLSLDLAKEFISSIGVLLDYIYVTQKKKISHLLFADDSNQNGYMKLDDFTLKSLEIVKKQNGEYKGSLKSVIDRTLTAGGKRLLNRFLHYPLNDLQEILYRQSGVDFLLSRSDLLGNISNLLKSMPDLNRALGRITFDKSSPRDLLNILKSLEKINDIADLLVLEQGLPKILQDVLYGLHNYNDIISSLKRALKDEVPLLARDGGFVREGFDSKFDEHNNIIEGLQSEILKLSKEYEKATGLNNIKVQYNNILGYFVEVSSKNANVLMNNDMFIHRQSMVNHARFTTTKLKELDSKIVNAHYYRVAREIEIFNMLVEKVCNVANKISESAFFISLLDVLSSFAILAKEKNLTKPILNQSGMLDIVNGTHIVVQDSLQNLHAGDFVTNSCCLKEDKPIMLLTGPNMSGKSTYLRQNALIIIMAQIGSYVAAERAEIGIVDSVFSRVGASDDLSRGQSTFMVEMLESAKILKNATSSSFIIFDEVGRGTSTFDGLALAWSILEFISNKNIRTVFATHYHELSQIAKTTKNVMTYKVDVKEWEEQIIFMHSVSSGISEGSYGINVAKIAGLDNTIITRAEKVLDNLAKKQGQTKALHQEDLFTPTIKKEPTLHKDLLNAIGDIDNLSAKKGLDKLYEVWNILKKVNK